MSTQPDEILIEIVTVGGSLRVTAIDPTSLVEVVFQAPVSADRLSIKRLARQKLAYRLGRATAAGPRPPARGGTLT